MLNKNELINFVKNKKVLITGHTGFKGAYLCILLNLLGAKIYGYALKEEAKGLFDLLNLRDILSGECIADVRDFDKLYSFVKDVNPDFIIHMAAQPLVIDSYKEPKYTYEVNVIGTVNILEAIRQLQNEYKAKNIKDFNLLSFLNVTTDKVYENNDLNDYAFKEDDKLCGYDPYANSKSCSELVTYSYKNSFFSDSKFSISTARAGNVIGAGDISENRIVPDCNRAIIENKNMFIRNKNSIRPYQYVLEPLITYLNILFVSSVDKNKSGSYNVGPDIIDCVNTEKIVNLFFKYYDTEKKPNVVAESTNESDFHESKFLKLDNSLVKKDFGFKSRYNIEESLEITAKGYKLFNEKDKNELLKYIQKTIENML